MESIDSLLETSNDLKKQLAEQYAIQKDIEAKIGKLQDKRIEVENKITSLLIKDGIIDNSWYLITDEEKTHLIHIISDDINGVKTIYYEIENDKITIYSQIRVKQNLVRDLRQFNAIKLDDEADTLVKFAINCEIDKILKEVRSIVDEANN